MIDRWASLVVSFEWNTFVLLGLDCLPSTNVVRSVEVWSLVLGMICTSWRFCRLFAQYFVFFILLFFAFKRCSWTVLNLQKVLQLRRAAADELQSALSRSLAASFWALQCSTKHRRIEEVSKKISEVCKQFWHVCKQFDMFWPFGRRCQTEADLERLQAAVEECKRSDKFSSRGNFTSWKENLRRIDASNFLEMFKGWHRT